MSSPHIQNVDFVIESEMPYWPTLVSLILWSVFFFYFSGDSTTPMDVLTKAGFVTSFIVAILVGVWIASTRQKDIGSLRITPDSIQILLQRGRTLECSLDMLRIEVRRWRVQGKLKEHEYIFIDRGSGRKIKVNVSQLPIFEVMLKLQQLGWREKIAYKTIPMELYITIGLAVLILIVVFGLKFFYSV